MIHIIGMTHYPVFLNKKDRLILKKWVIGWRGDIGKGNGRGRRPSVIR